MYETRHSDSCGIQKEGQITKELLLTQKAADSLEIAMATLKGAVASVSNTQEDTKQDPDPPVESICNIASVVRTIRWTIEKEVSKINEIIRRLEI